MYWGVRPLTVAGEEQRYSCPLYLVIANYTYCCIVPGEKGPTFQGVVAIIGPGLGDTRPGLGKLGKKHCSTNRQLLTEKYVRMLQRSRVW